MPAIREPKPAERASLRLTYARAPQSVRAANVRDVAALVTQRLAVPTLALRYASALAASDAAMPRFWRMAGSRGFGAPMPAALAPLDPNQAGSSEKLQQKPCLTQASPSLAQSRAVQTAVALFASAATEVRRRSLQLIAAAPVPSPSLRFEVGIHQFFAGDYSAAITTFTSLHEQFGFHQDVEHMLGGTHLYSGNLKEAEKHLVAAVGGKTVLPSAKLLAITYAKMGRFLDAEKALFVQGASGRSAEEKVILMILQAKRGMIGLAARNADVISQAPSVSVPLLLITSKIKLALLESTWQAGLISNDKYRDKEGEIHQTFARKAFVADPQYITKQSEHFAAARALLSFKLNIPEPLAR